MSDGAPNPQRMLAVLLGASNFERAPSLAQGPAFYMSAQGFKEYLTDASGLKVPQENVCWRFDDSRSPSEQLEQIAEFLDRRSAALRGRGITPEDLILYYVGHGLFSGPEHAYCLAVRATDERNEGLTSIRVADLASVVKTYARFQRKFLILDCCFSGAAPKEFQSGALQAGRVKVLNEFPQKGTALLCSASAQDPSLAPAGLPRTMFTDALLRSLRRGHPSLGSWLSLSEVGDLVKASLQEAYPDTWVRPEVHSPDQREGDVAGVSFFPNAARREEVEEAKRAEAERVEREQAEQERRAEEARKAEEERLRIERQNEERRRAEEKAKRAEAERVEREQAEQKRRAEEAEKAEEERLRIQRENAERRPCAEEEENLRTEEEKNRGANRGQSAQQETDRLPIGNRCLGCMSDKGTARICPKCGWEEGTPGSPQHLTPSTVLDGKYLVGRALGQGGFGITYLSWDLFLNCKLAIKEYFPRDLCTRGKDEHTVQPFSDRTKESFGYGLGKFVEEGQALVRFRDRPGIVSVLGYFRENRTAYLVMPYLEGQTFKQYLEEHGGKIPFPEAFGILAGVMNALGEVHRVGILHRDISPDNIYLCETGQVKLLDFGAARNAIGESTVDRSVVVRRGYAPPEQFRRRGRQGPWTDVYALGATFYWAITGRTPSDAPDRLENDDLVAPSRLGIDIPAKSETALLKALAVRSERRYQSVAEFQKAVTPPGPPPPIPWRVRVAAAITTLSLRFGPRVKRVVPAAIGAAVVLAAVVAAVGSARFMQERGQRRLEQEARQLEDQGQLGKALEKWHALAAQSGPLQAGALAAATRVSGGMGEQAQHLENHGGLAEALVEWQALAALSGPWQTGASASATRVSAQMGEQAQQLENQGQLAEALAKWQALAALRGPWQAGASASVTRVQGRIQEAQNAWNGAKQAEDSNQYDEAEAQYNKAGQLDPGLKASAEAAIQRVEALKASLSQQQLEAADYNRGLSLLKGGDYQGARAAFKNVLKRNLPGSTLVPQAQAQLGPLGTLLQDQHRFDQAVVDFKARRYDQAKPVFSDLVNRKTRWQKDSQDYLNQISNQMSQAQEKATHDAQANAAKQAVETAKDAVETKLQGGLYAEALALLPRVSEVGGSVDDLKAQIQHGYDAEFGQLQTRDQNENNPQRLGSIAQSLENLAQRAGSPLGDSARNEANRVREKINALANTRFWVRYGGGRFGWLSVSGTTLRFEEWGANAKADDNFSLSCSEIKKVGAVPNFTTGLSTGSAHFGPAHFHVRASKNYEFDALGAQGELNPAQMDKILASISHACPHSN